MHESRIFPARRSAIAALAAGLALGLAAAGCSGSSEAQSGQAGRKAAQPAQAQPNPQQQAQHTEPPPAEDAITIAVEPVRRESLSRIYSTSATLRADKRATVTARTEGVVEELRVEEGDWVEQDQPLAILENDAQQIAYNQAQATYETNQRTFERAQSLHEQGLMSDEEFEVTRRQAVDSKHTAELAELTLSRTIIRAPFAGRILSRHLDVGATVGDGVPVYDLADLSPLYADVQIPERQITQLQPGQTVRLMDDAGRPVGEAAIERIAPQVDPGTGTVKVTVAVREASGLRPGSFVRAGIVTDTHRDVLVVPRSALVSEGRSWYLYRLNDEGTHVERFEVERGFEESDRVEILQDPGATERPLALGDRVVVVGAPALSDGAAVEVLEGAEERSVPA